MTQYLIDSQLAATSESLQTNGGRPQTDKEVSQLVESLEQLGSKVGAPLAILFLFLFCHSGVSHSGGLISTLTISPGHSKVGIFDHR